MRKYKNEEEQWFFHLLFRKLTEELKIKGENRKRQRETLSPVKKEYQNPQNKKSKKKGSNKK